jgi:hypothetical protein
MRRTRLLLLLAFTMVTTLAAFPGMGTPHLICPICTISEHCCCGVLGPGCGCCRLG